MAIFGTPGLVQMYEMYDVLHEKMQTYHKPIFPILPSVNTAGAEVADFLAKGHVNFADEVTLATALARIVNAPHPAANELELFGVDIPRIRRIIDATPSNGYLPPHQVHALLRAAGIPVVEEFVSAPKEEMLKDVSSGLDLLSYAEAYSMIHSLRAYKIIQGTRGPKRGQRRPLCRNHRAPLHPAAFRHRNQGDGHQSAAGNGR